MIARTNPRSLAGVTLTVPLACVVGVFVGEFSLGEAIVGGGAIALALSAGFIWLWGRNAIWADEEGPIVVTRGRTDRPYGWRDLTTVDWDPGSFWLLESFPWGASLVVSPQGGPFDVPGPNNPVRLGNVMLVWPWERRAATSRAGAVVERFTSDGTGRRA